MERQKIKINSKGLVERTSDSNFKKTFTIDSFYTMWLENICEKNRVSSFKFTGPNEISITYLQTDEFSCEDVPLVIKLEESAMNNEKFMGYMCYLETVFENNKDEYHARYEDIKKREIPRVQTANACLELLKRCDSDKAIRNFGTIENLDEIRFYFYSHRGYIEKKRDDIVGIKHPKLIKWGDIFSAIGVMTMLVAFIGFWPTLLISVDHTAIATTIARIFLCPLFGVGGVSLFARSAINRYKAHFFEDNVTRFIKVLEKQYGDNSLQKKGNDFEDILANIKEYMAELNCDFQQDRVELDNFAHEIETNASSDLETKYTEIGQLLGLEYRIYSKENRVGKKEATSYTLKHLNDILSYIGIDTNELEDGVLLTLINTCETLLNDPFYGCELEVTRLLITILTYLKDKDVDASPLVYLDVATTALAKRKEVMRLEELKSARDDVACLTRFTVPSEEATKDEKTKRLHLDQSSSAE